MERCIKKSKSDVLESAYDPEIRMFAINLHFYSAKAYNYVRSILHDALPCERTLRLWTNKILSTPGFCERSFFLLKMKKEEMEAESKGKLIVSLILDEMLLKKHLHFDGEKIVGGIDLGQEYDGNCAKTEASEVLVFMVNAINMKFKIPVTYFFINGLSAQIKSSLLTTCITKLINIGIEVSNVTFDGPSVHLSMAKQMGAILDPDNLDPRIGLKLNKPLLPCLFDPPHMIKLIRNALGSLTYLKKGSKIISWIYFEKLYQLQTQTGIHLANKLSRAHIEWE